MAGIQFQSTSSASTSAMEISLKDMWNRISASGEGDVHSLPSLESIGVKTAPSGVYPGCIQLPVHVSLEHCDLSVKDATTSSDRFTLQFKSLGSSPSISELATVSVSGHQKDMIGQVNWESQDLLLSASGKDFISPIISITMLVNDAVVGDADFIVPLNPCKNGVPVKLFLPMKNSESIRIALLPISLQVTAFNSISNSPTKEADTVDQSVLIRVEFCDGNILIPSNRKSIDPFFECQIVAGSSANSPQPENYSPVRTAFLPVRAGAAINWNNIACSISIPPQQLATTAGMYSLLVECKDASILGYPTIGKARIALTGAFLSKTKPLEQWVVLSSPSGRTSAENRIMIRLVPQLLSADGLEDNGMGVVLFKLNSITSSHSGDDSETLQSAKLTVPAVTSPIEKSSAEKAIFATVVASTSCLRNELKLLNDAALLAALNVTSGNPSSEITIDLKTSTTSTMYSGSLQTATILRMGPPTPDLVLQNNNLELNLQKVKGTQRNVSRLNMELAYVPFVSGKLLIDYKKIDILEPSAIAKGSADGEDTFKGVLRFTLTDRPANFICSDQFAMSRTGGYFNSLSSNESLASQSQSKKISSSSRILNKFDKSSAAKSRAPGVKSSLKSGGEAVTTSIVTILVDTFEAFRIETSSKNSNNGPLMPLLVDLIQIDPDTQTGNNVAAGYVSTASVFYPAVRAAASSSLTMLDAKSKQEGFSSPYYETQINLYDSLSRKCIAVVSVNIRFLAEAIPRSTLTTIQNSLAVIAEADAKALAKQANLELALKHAFLSADTDNSGTVSSDEVLKCIFLIPLRY